MGQLTGAGVMAACGFVPGYVISLVLRIFRLLRVPPAAERLGLDLTKVPAEAYPEGPASLPNTGAAAARL